MLNIFLLVLIFLVAELRGTEFGMIEDLPRELKVRIHDF